MTTPTVLDLGYIMGPPGEQGTGLPPTHEDILAVIAEHSTSDVRPDDRRLLTSYGAWLALNENRSNRVIEHLSAPFIMNVGEPDLNKELYYSNGGNEDNSLDVVLPKTATSGDEFFLEFRSTGTEGCAAVLRLAVEAGGKLFCNGELNGQAYCTRITAKYAFGTWLANIETFQPTSGVSPDEEATIVYSGYNHIETRGTVFSDTVVAGSNRLRDDIFLAMYGSPLSAWKDTNNQMYPRNAVVTVPANSTLQLMPVFKTITEYGTWGRVYYSYQRTTRADSEWHETTFVVNPSIALFKELHLRIKLSGKIEKISGSGSAEIRHSPGGSVATLVSSGAIGTIMENTSNWIDLTREEGQDFRYGYVIRVGEGTYKFEIWISGFEYVLS